MKAFWTTLAQLATKVALYAAEHPDQVIAIANGVKAGRK